MQHIMAYIGLKLLDIFVNYGIYSERPCDNIGQKLWGILRKNYGIYYGIYFSKAMSYI